MNLANNTVLITGGATGIGFALAERFLAAGSEVIICGRRQMALDDAYAKQPCLKTIQCDVSVVDERVRLIETIQGEFPRLNILVNNAGIQNRPKPITEPQDWAAHRREIAINLEAPMHLTMLFIPFLLRQPNPAIVNITSGPAFVPMASMPTYCLTKAALHSFTQSVRHQLRETPVQVFEVAPPAVNTDLGGPGLHTFGVPLGEFGDHTMSRLAAGDLEFGYQFSAAGLNAGAEDRKAIFERMNNPAR